MLHMVVATHGPESCPVVAPDSMNKASSAIKRMGEVTKALGITVQGSWTNMPGHVMYFLLDAPNAHVVNQMAMELQLMDWNTVDVNPVITVQEAMTRLQQRKP
jgi:muconolactone delta-isomerase